MIDSRSSEESNFVDQPLIHPTAVVHPRARIAEGVKIGPYSVIGADVDIKSGTEVKSHVVIQGPTSIGRNNRIFQFASVGDGCQDLKYKGEPTRLEIGDNNAIRENCTIHRGTVQDEGVTSIGNNNLLMAYVHIAHDCRLGDNIIMANNTSLAGHVRVGNGVIFGGFSLVHQFCVVGDYSMSAASTTIFKDVPAFVMVGGSPSKPRGMNFEGMRRRGYSSDLINTLKNCYKIVYRQGLKVNEAVDRLETMGSEYSEVMLLINSLKSSTRGIIR